MYYVSGTIEETFIQYISPLSHNDIQINPGTVVEAYQDACKLKLYKTITRTECHQIFLS